MAHTRKRHLASVLEHLAALSPLVGLIGHRQVGKTTLLESIAARYLSLDDHDDLRAANGNPKSFLSALQSPGTAIDECQNSPQLFPALKERVRKDRRPGQFYLLGSIRFTSKKLIRESLTGRIMTAELHPLTLSELDRAELPDWIPRLLKARRAGDMPLPRLPAGEYRRRMRLIAQYETQGGLPGACFIRNHRIRTQKLLDQIETILDRDLRQIHDTTLTLPELLRLLRELAQRDSGPIQHQSVRRATGISPITQKKLLFALEAVFIIRAMPIEGDYRGSAHVFEDQAEVALLARDRLSDEQRWSGLILRNVREQVDYRIGLNAEYFQYRTRAGVVVPIGIRTEDNVLGLVPIRGDLSRAAAATGHSFLRRYANAKVVFVTDVNDSRVIDDRSLQISAAQLLFPWP